MGLDKKTRNCQTMETYNECVTNGYIKNLRLQCGCLPLISLTEEKVGKSIMLT